MDGYEKARDKAIETYKEYFGKKRIYTEYAYKFAYGSILSNIGIICKTGVLMYIMSASFTTASTSSETKSTAPHSIALFIEAFERDNPVIKILSFSLSFNAKPITEWEVPYVYIVGGSDAHGMLLNNVWKGTITRLTYRPLY